MGILGVAININVKNENEFNQQLQMYLAQGYRMQSNFNGTAILSKKNYSTGLLIILIIFGFGILGIVYYLVASNDVVTITNNAENPSTTSSSNNENFIAYCPNCGHGLFKDSKFCPGCGNVIENNQGTTETTIEEESDNEEIIDLTTNLVCKNCGEELAEDAKFCPNCGNDLTTENNLIE